MIEHKMNLTVRCYSQETGALHDEPVEMGAVGCEVRLSTLSAASVVHALFTCAGSAVRAEVDASQNETVCLEVTHDAERGLAISSRSHPLVLLPADERYAPPEPFTPPQNGRLDLAVLIDATTSPIPRQLEGTPPGLARLLDSPDDWQPLAAKLVKFASCLTQTYSDLRFSILAFADESMDFIASAPDLVCPSPVFPKDRQDSRLRPFDGNSMQRDLFELRSSSGGDFVDALADGLLECGYVGWRTDARRLVLLLGDSPGFSLLYPPPPGADIHIRGIDVDSEAINLHTAHKAEIATIYVPIRDRGYITEKAEPLVRHARNQYRRLASHPSLAWMADAFDPEQAAQGCATVAGPVTRGTAYGVFAGASPLEVPL